MKPYANAKIVVPIDFSEDTDKAIEVAIAIAAARSQITAVHVAPPISAFEPGIVFAATDASRRENLLQVIHRRYADAKFRDIQFAVLFGDPGQEIVQFAKRTEASLVVMPSHGRTGREHLLIGSVAERVVRLAHCPVLVLRH